MLSLPALTIHWLLAVARELLQLLRINSLQLRAAEGTNDTTDSIGELGQGPEEDIRLGLGRELVDEAAQVVALEEVGRVKETTSEVGNVNASERVSLAEVATDVQELGVKLGSVQDVDKEVVDLIGVLQRTPVPVCGNFLGALHSIVVAVGSLDTKPRLDGLVAEQTLWVLCTVVRHEAVDESVRGGLHE